MSKQALTLESLWWESNGHPSRNLGEQMTRTRQQKVLSGQRKENASTVYILKHSLFQKGRLLMTVCVSSSTGSKYNQEFSDLAVMIDTASW